MATAFLFSVSSVNVGQYNAPVSSAHDEALRKGVTIFFDELTDDFAMGVLLKNDKFIWSLIASGEYFNKENESDFSLFYFGSFFGLQKALSSHVELSYGVMGNYGIYSSRSKADASSYTASPYVYGGYVGFTYNINPNSEVFAQTMPVSRENSHSGAKEHESFQEGAVGVTCFFS